MAEQDARIGGAARGERTLCDRESTKSAGFKNALRLQESFTAPVEREVLAWLAARLPAQVNSDHLTLIGFAAILKPT